MGATDGLAIDVQAIVISTHASVWGAVVDGKHPGTYTVISIPAPHMESDTDIDPGLKVKTIFQSTPPCGRRLSG